MDKALKKFDYLHLWKKVSIIYLIWFIITISFVPISEGGFEDGFITILASPLVVLHYRPVGFIIWFAFWFAFVFLTLLSAFINLIFSVVANKRSLLLAKIFTLIQICLIIGSSILIYIAYKEIISLFIILSLVSLGALILLSLFQLILVFNIKTPEDSPDEKALKLARKFVIIILLLVSFCWGSLFPHYLPYVLFIVLTANVVVNFFFPKKSLLLKSLGIGQTIVLGTSVLLQIGYFFNKEWGWEIDAPIWYFGMISFALALVYLIHEKKEKKAESGLFLKMLSLGCWLLVVVPNAISIKEINHLIMDNHNVIYQLLYLVLNAFIFGLSILIIGTKTRAFKLLLGILCGIIIIYVLYYLLVIQEKFSVDNFFAMIIFITISLVTPLLSLLGLLVTSSVKRKFV